MTEQLRPVEPGQVIIAAARMAACVESLDRIARVTHALGQAALKNGLPLEPRMAEEVRDTAQEVIRYISLALSDMGFDVETSGMDPGLEETGRGGTDADHSGEIAPDEGPDSRQEDLMQGPRFAPFE